MTENKENKEKTYQQPRTSPGFVACTPIPQRASSGSIKDSIVNLGDLVELTVVFGNFEPLCMPLKDMIISRPGDRVYIKSPSPTEPWVKAIYTLCLGDVCHRFILVPEACVLLRRSEDFISVGYMLGGLNNTDFQNDYRKSYSPEGYVYTNNPYLPYVPIK